MQIGDLVKVTAKDLRVPIGSAALITRVQERALPTGIVTQYWARMMDSGHVFWFRPEALEVISASR